MAPVVFAPGNSPPFRKVIKLRQMEGMDNIFSQFCIHDPVAQVKATVLSCLASCLGNFAPNLGHKIHPRAFLHEG
jgi:hypothetical protein